MMSIKINCNNYTDARTLAAAVNSCTPSSAIVYCDSIGGYRVKIIQED